MSQISPTERHRKTTERVLLSLARGRTGAISPELLVGHVLNLYDGIDWPTQKAAMEAVLRRVAAALGAPCRVAGQPDGNAPSGFYKIKFPEGAKSHRVLLRSLEPLRGSCDCEDFLWNSLGLCPHLAAVLVELSSDAERYEQARAASTAGQQPARLEWDPLCPLRGPADPLLRVRLLPGETPGGARSPAITQIREWFATRGEFLALKEAVTTPDRKRLDVVSGLLAFLRSGPRGTSVDPALRALLGGEKNRLEKALAAGGASGKARRALKTLGRKMFPYQREGVERTLAAGRMLIADEIGLGKTTQAIAACHALFKSEVVRRGLVIVPSGREGYWRHEWRRLTDTPLTLLRSSSRRRAAAYRGRKSGFVLVDHAHVASDIDHMLAFKPDVVVLDEPLHDPNWSGRTAGLIRRLRSDFRVALNSIPPESRLEQLASIVEWIDERALEPRWRLTPWHSMFVPDSTEVIGRRNLDVLWARLSHCMLRRRRQEVRDQLPAATETFVPVELADAQRQALAVLDPSIDRLGRLARAGTLTQPGFLRLVNLLAAQRVVANGIAQLRFDDVWPAISRVERPEGSVLTTVAMPKLVEFRELLARVAVDQGRKVAVFSEWRRMLALAHWAVRDLLRSHGMRAAFATGRQGRRRRARDVADLHEDPATRVLFATDTGAAGLDLGRAVSCCINLELPLNPAVRRQRIERLTGVARDEPFDVFDLVSRNSIEMRIADLEPQELTTIAGLFDGATGEPRFGDAGALVSFLLPEAEPAPARSPETGRIEDIDATADPRVNEILNAADESSDPSFDPTADGPPGVPLPVPTSDEIKRLVEQLQVRSTDGGGLEIRATAEAAETLAVLLRAVLGVVDGR